MPPAAMPPRPDSPDAIPEAGLVAMEAALQHRFRDRDLLITALTHPSMIDMTHVSFERLEFLGDAVVGLVIGEHLYRLYPGADEGELTRIKSSCVSRTALGHLGRRLRVVDHLRMAKGMLHQGPIPRSVASNAAEALIGAIYLDGGIEVARQFVLRELGSFIRRGSTKRPATNHKSLLQIQTQELGLGTPSYEVLSVSGRDHERTFEVRARLGKRTFPPASGPNKKRAEQRAAKNALRALGRDVDPTDDEEEGDDER